MLHSSTQKLLLKLHEMTLDGAIAWKEAEGDAVRLETEGYCVLVTPDPIGMELTTVKGRVLEKADETVLQATRLNDERSFVDIILEISKEGSRYARGTEQAINAILGAAETGALSEGLDFPFRDESEESGGGLDTPETAAMAAAVGDLAARLNSEDYQLINVSAPAPSTTEAEPADESPAEPAPETAAEQADLTPAAYESQMDAEPDAEIAEAAQDHNMIEAEPVAGESGETQAAEHVDVESQSHEDAQPDAEPAPDEAPDEAIVAVQVEPVTMDAAQTAHATTTEEHAPAQEAAPETVATEEAQPIQGDAQHVEETSHDAAADHQTPLEPVESSTPQETISTQDADEDGSDDDALPPPPEDFLLDASAVDDNRRPHEVVRDESAEDASLAAPVGQGVETPPAPPPAPPKGVPTPPSMPVRSATPETPSPVGFQQPVFERPKEAKPVGEGLKKVTALGFALGRHSGATVRGIPDDIEQRAADRARNANGAVREDANGAYKPWG